LWREHRRQKSGRQNGQASAAAEVRLSLSGSVFRQKG
jgi:hypothetical protein